MDRRTLGLLAGVVVVLMVLVATVGQGGISRELQAQLQTEVENLEDARQEFGRDRDQVRRALSEHPDLFDGAGYDVTWPERLAEAGQRLDAAADDLRRAEELVETNQSETEPEVEQLLSGARARRAYAVGEGAELSQGAERRVDFKQNLDQHLADMADAHRVIAGADLDAARRLVERAGADWPEKRPDLVARLDAIESSIREADRAWRAAEEARTADPPPYESLLLTEGLLADARRDVTESLATLPGLVDELYWTWERVLADMEIVEGAEVSFRHRYEVVKTHIEDVEERTNTVTEESEWVPVTKRTYDDLDQNLGMTVERKPAGVFDHEAEKVVQPAGLGYIASPEAGKNQYGYWNQGAGGSFWVFYGQYALMRDLLWGAGGYRPFSARTWDDYDSHRRTGRPYYGRTGEGRPMYGSRGAHTQSRYAGSRYVRSGGFESSRYVKSGGTFRGTRYASSSGGSRSSGYRGGRSGSRFGGGK